MEENFIGSSHQRISTLDDHLLMQNNIEDGGDGLQLNQNSTHNMLHIHTPALMDQSASLYQLFEKMHEVPMEELYRKQEEIKQMEQIVK